ncbi:DUF4380 domain-containing protein [Pseudoxanthomonas sp. SGNA-20]|uniref:DUF4380 domain-containing protein n=1 Tax=Pseudoxanthomonas TaxID=83618 RepID=UPI000402C195|nr:MULTISPECIES: DUF4380 domain-containing protein [Pseudoxanthomonas]RRN55926.1 DUF4380 domain-containing protein [Pseudoxanthomonas sp. SGNA-20]RRN79277.1 DUF4380 domain-containing protein [Pseudoxanthomonas sp. SGD-10]
MRKSLLAALLGAASLAAVAAEPPVPLRMRLQGPALQMDVSPRLGGRILHLSLPGAPNLLLEGPAVQAEPDPQVRADGDNIPYLGHEVWVGPQSEWWTHQALNPARRKAGAIWPPDPWLAHAPAKVLEQGDARLVVEGAASPVSGVQLTQSFNLAHDRAELVVDMRNIRKEPVARDIWFNSRVPPQTRVYVPVAADGSGVRVRSDTDGGYDALVSRSDDGLFSLELLPPGEGLLGRRGKVFIQPQAGWIAGFNAGQAFVIHFEKQPLERIHPEQGQVELYLDWRPDPAYPSLMELEVHAPYVALEPGQSTSARQWWIVRRYDGPDRRDAQVAFLRRMLDEAGIE